MSSIIRSLSLLSSPPSIDSVWVLDHSLNTPNKTMTIPFYFTHRSRLIPYISDEAMVVLTPFITYWSVYLLLQLSLSLHSPRTSRQRRPWRLIIEIQLVQTIFGWIWLKRFGNQRMKDPIQDLQNTAQFIGTTLPLLMGKANARDFLDQHGQDLFFFAYWWAIPVMKLFLASFIMDAWQTLLYRVFHNFYLFPDVRAFLFDTVGICVAYSLSRLSDREAVIFLALSVMQTFNRGPRSSPRIQSPPNSSVFFKVTPSISKKYVPFRGFRKQAYMLARWYFEVLNIEPADSQRIRYAMRHAKHQARSGPKRPRPQLRIITNPGTKVSRSRN